jgi:flavin reductase (DIM6/NTAB) family NADH-FMN oxidoreductase RutF
MNKSFILLAATALILTACNSKNENPTNQEVKQTNNQTMELKKVEERTNMGDKLYVTPQPALMIATYDADGNPDVMMAAWGGQFDYKQVCFSLSKHKTTDNLRLNKAFTLSYADARTVAQSDYFGIVSGNDVPDKVAKAGFTVTKSQNVNAPIINEYPLAMECRVIEMHDDEEGGAWVVGEIVNAIADPSILTDGKIDIKKLNPVVWDASSLNYITLGDSVGKAWNSGNIYK